MFVSIYDKSKSFTKDDLGGKGHSLWDMARLGINVPPAMILPPSVCIDYQKDPKLVMQKIAASLATLGKFFQEKLGFIPLVSVRSGAKDSMPGMMDTILNVGLDDQTKPFWVDRLGEACVQNSRDRLVEMYGNVVKGIDRHKLETLGIVAYKNETGEDFPDAYGQLLGSIEAVLKSWNNPRAIAYRKLNGIPDTGGTAVIIQAMVFGNMNDRSATGVLFTRNPDTGADEVVGDFLVNAQGEDVVAGIRTPLPLIKMTEWNPKVADELLSVARKLEENDRDAMDIEFTVEDGKLYILQKRVAKRTAFAAVRIAYELYSKSTISLDEMFDRVSARQLDLAQQPVIDPKFKDAPVYTGIPACSGVAIGKVVKSSDAAIGCKDPCILVTQETTPDDILGMNAARGILTMTGGSTSHAAVVARSMNRVCVTGLGIDLDQFEEGETISLDGATGRVWRGAVPVIDGSSNPVVEKFVAEMMKAANAVMIVPADQLPAKKCDRLIVDMTPMFGRPASELEAVLKQIDKFIDKPVLNLSKPLSEEESGFFSMMGVNPGFEATRIANAVGAMKIKADLIFDGAVTMGQSLIKTCKTVEQVLLASDDFMWAGPTTEASKKLFALMAKAGVQGPAVYDEIGEKKSWVRWSTLVGGLLK